MSSIVISGNTSGSVTLSAPDVAGSTTQTLVNASGTLAPLVSGTAATVSGTSVDFTGIPSWVKRITVMFSGVNTTVGAQIVVQLGTGGSPTTSGYQSTAGTRVVEVGSTTSLVLTGARLAADLASGLVTICLLSGNTYSSSGTMTRGTTGTPSFNAGTVTLGGTLDMVRITSSTGTDTFNAGTVNIMYE